MGVYLNVILNPYLYISTRSISQATLSQILPLPIVSSLVLAMFWCTCLLYSDLELVMFVYGTLSLLASEPTCTCWYFVFIY